MGFVTKTISASKIMAVNLNQNRKFATDFSHLWEKKMYVKDLDKWKQYQLEGDPSRLVDFKYKFLRDSLIKEFNLSFPKDKPEDVLKSMIILDVGCGTGTFAYNLFSNQIGSIILGID